MGQDRHDSLDGEAFGNQSVTFSDRLLQIRAMMASDEWESKCQGAVLSALGAVA
jgi:hypothetical protein